MFERFTDRARRVVVLAQEEARLLNHDYIGTEHILLGLVHEEQGVAARALTELDISLDSDRRASYFRQAAFGVPIRMALISLILGLSPDRALTLR